MYQLPPHRLKKEGPVKRRVEQHETHFSHWNWRQQNVGQNTAN